MGTNRSLTSDYALDLLGERDILAEQSVIGAILIDERAYPVAAELLKPEDFVIPYCRAVFQISGEFFAAGKPVDPVSLFSAVKQAGNDLPRETFLQLMEVTPTAAHVKVYAKTVQDNARRRAVRELCHTILDDPAGGGELLETLVKGVDELTANATRNRTATLSALTNALLADTLDYMDGKKKALSTGFSKLDQGLGGGLTPGMLVILAGRPGMGKTTFALAVAENLARQGAVLYITLEMTGKQVAAKLYARHTGVPARNILTGTLEEEQNYRLLEKQREVNALNLVLNDRMGVTVEEIGLMARSVKGLAAVFVDHLGLIHAKYARRQSRYEQVTEISGALKRLALTLQVPVIALSQLSRENEKRKNPRPQLSDLRESGSIEQDADAVLLLHRDDYEETATGYNYESSIDGDTYNRVKLAMDNSDTGVRETYVTNDGENQSRWGVLQYYEKLDSEADSTALATKANALLSYYNRKQRKLQVTGAFGDIRVRGGSLLPVRLDLGDQIVSSYIMVETVTHKFKQGQHTMDLTLVRTEQGGTASDETTVYSSRAATGTATGTGNDKKLYSATDATMIARVMYLEARGIASKTELACVGWTILNRVDAGYGSIQAVITAPNQFAYSSTAKTVSDYGYDLVALATDVCDRWSREKAGQTDVGRVLPRDYLWYAGNGKHNFFRNAFRGGTRWTYSLPSPYEN